MDLWKARAVGRGASRTSQCKSPLHGLHSSQSPGQQFRCSFPQHVELKHSQGSHLQHLLILMQGLQVSFRIRSRTYFRKQMSSPLSKSPVWSQAKPNYDLPASATWSRSPNPGKFCKGLHGAMPCSVKPGASTVLTKSLSAGDTSTKQPNTVLSQLLVIRDTSHIATIFQWTIFCLSHQWTHRS